MDLVIERFRRQDAIPLPCKRSWRTIVDVLCDAFEAVEKMDLVIILSREAQLFRAFGKDVCGQSSTIITSDRLSSPTPSFVVLSSNSSGRVLVTLVLVKQLTVKRTLSESSQTRAPPLLPIQVLSSKPQSSSSRLSLSVMIPTNKTATHLSPPSLHNPRHTFDLRERPYPT